MVVAVVLSLNRRPVQAIAIMSGLPGPATRRYTPLTRYLRCLPRLQLRGWRDKPASSDIPVGVPRRLDRVKMQHDIRAERDGGRAETLEEYEPPIGRYLRF